MDFGLHFYLPVVLRGCILSQGSLLEQQLFISNALKLPLHICLWFVPYKLCHSPKYSLQVFVTFLVEMPLIVYFILTYSYSLSFGIYGTMLAVVVVSTPFCVLLTQIFEGRNNEKSGSVWGAVSVCRWLKRSLQTTKIADYGCKLMSKIQVRRAALKHKLLVHQV